MFRVACFVLFALVYPAFGQNLRWADLVESRIYKVDREIRLVHNNTNFTLNEGDELRLLDFKPLQVINVYLAEFKPLNCDKLSFISEMSLIEIEQVDGQTVAVGVDMAKKCVFEVFIEKKDYNARSMFR